MERYQSLPETLQRLRFTPIIPPSGPSGRTAGMASSDSISIILQRGHKLASGVDVFGR